MKLMDNRDRVGSILILLFSFFYLRFIFEIPFDPTAGDAFFTPRTLPTGLAVLTIVCAFFQLFLPVKTGEELSLRKAVEGFEWMPMISLLLLMLVYSLSFNFFGFAVATFLFLLGGFSILGERRLKVSISVAGGLTLFMWGVLTQLFDLYLDSGSLYRLVLGGA